MSIRGKMLQGENVHRSARKHRPARKQSIYGWLGSLLFHGAWLLGLGLLIDSPPHGASRLQQFDTGIILERSSETEDDSDDDDSPETDATTEIEMPAIELSLESTEEPNELAASSQSPLPLVVPLPQEPLPQEKGLLVTEQGTVPTVPAELPGGSIFDSIRPDMGDRATGAGRWPQVEGGKARVSVFGVTGVGTKFVYLFDRSVSMYGTPLATAKRQLLQSLDSLDSIHQFQIVFFNHRITIFDHTEGQQRIAFATEVNKELASRFVSAVTADGGTDRYVALGQAIRLRPDVIFFLTDADDPMPTGELADIAKRNRRIGATINTIEFGSGVEHGRYNFLKRLAEQSGGQYGYVDTRRLKGGR